jgi:hypothetical protein
VPGATVEWRRVSGPFFGNILAEFLAEGRRATTVLHRSARHADGGLRELSRLVLSA